MTQEMIIEQLERHRTEFAHDHGWNASVLESLDAAIKLLKQESCDDLISRQAAIDELVRWGAIPEYNEAEKNILACCIGMLSTLPSVQQTQRTGKWEIHFILNERYLPKFTQICICKRCGGKLYRYEGQDISFCPSCGAKMVDPQGSEEE